MHENPAHAINTGGSSGIGLSVACLLAKEGVSVSILARDQARLAGARNQISSVAADESGVEAISCDVRSMPACQAAVERAISVHGVPNWAISCAGKRFEIAVISLGCAPVVQGRPAPIAHRLVFLPRHWTV